MASRKSRERRRLAKVAFMQELKDARDLSRLTKAELIEIAENKGYPVYHGKDGNKINSGWLIEHAGLSGKLFHGMRISDKAALVLINESAKSYNDLAKARDEIIGKVYDVYGYWLEQEPVEIS